MNTALKIDHIGVALRAYVIQHNAKARMFNCAELDVENLSDNDRVRLLEQIDDDMIHLNLTNGGSLPPDAVAKKRQLLEDAARDINVYGPRVVSAIRR